MGQIGFSDYRQKAPYNFDSRLDVIIHRPISREELIGKSDNEIIVTIKELIESVYQ